MKIVVLADAAEAAQEAAGFIAGQAQEAVPARGCFSLALSGGRSPGRMLEYLAVQEIAWDRVYLAQVDERLAPPGHPDRNLTQLEEHLLTHIPLPAHRFYPMPVEAEDLGAAPAHYEEILRQIAGSPPVLDLIHLGLGTDGHTASLTPGDPVLEITDQDVALTGVYQGRRRLTLTFPLLNRARSLVWLVTGAPKADVAARLFHGDPSMPAGRVCRDRARLFVDRDAARLCR